MTSSRRRFPDFSTELPPHLKFVLGLSPSAMTLGLGNIHALLERLGNPQRSFRTVVVAGTNGKGSVTAMAASLLHAQGMRTGRYTSPHVFSVTERIAIDDRPVSLEMMERAAARVAPLRTDIPFSYFEALTAIAFLVFAESAVEVAVLETGLGGRFDATNVTDPLVTVITSISLDHRRILGDTEEEILREKLGILRPGVPLLIGHFPPALREIISERAARDRIPLIGIEQLGSAKPTRAGLVALCTPLQDYGEVALPFPGDHQLINVRLALGAAERVAGRLERVGEGLSAAYLPGRYEQIEHSGKTFVLDVAHNDAALAAAAAVLGARSPRRESAVVIGLMKRKELRAAPAKLCQTASRIYLVSPEAPGGPGEGVYAPHELYGEYFHPLLSPFTAAAGRSPSQSSLTDFRPDAILWNRTDTGDDWGRLLHALSHPDNPCRTILVMGSHHVVEPFARRLFSDGEA